MTEEERQQLHEKIWGKPKPKEVTIEYDDTQLQSAGLQHQPTEEPADEPRKPPAPKPHEPATPPEGPKPPAEGGEPVEPEPQEAMNVQMTGQQFQLLLASVISEARRPVLDEKKVAQQKRMREHNRMMMQDQRKMLVARFQGCNHMQLPGSVMSGCSCIAWATQSDGKRRGTCQHCGTIFSSEREECASQEIWEAYKMLVRLPTHPAGNINHVFQAA